jgi:hypothetical protein
MKNTESLQDILKSVNSNIYASTKGKLEPENDPAIAGLAYSVAQVKHALYADLIDSINQIFARSATDESFLAAIAFDKTNNIIRRKDAEFASGKILVISEEAVDISVGSQFIATDGNVYESTVFRSTFSNLLAVESLERISNIAYLTIPDHNLGNLMELTIAGENESGFNGVQEVAIVDKDTLSYASVGSDEEATGTITAEFFGNRIDVKSTLPNASSNKTFNNSVELGFTTDATNAYITFNGITGGSDIEDLQSFKDRIVEFLQYPQNAGNKYQHQTWIKQNTDANYCYVFNSEDALYLYLTAVVSKVSKDYYFTNFTNDELVNMKAKFIDDNQLALSGVSSLQVSFVNITPVNIGIAITGLTPDSNSMRTAIENRLRAYMALLPINFYLNSGQLSSDKISSIINGARDESGNVPSINSVAISGDTFTTDSDKPILGVVSYA